MRSFLLLAWLMAAVAAVAASGELRKCCPLEHSLHAGPSCKLDLEETDWKPLIYSASNNGGGFKIKPDMNLDVMPYEQPVCKDGSRPVFVRTDPALPTFMLLEVHDQIVLTLPHAEGPPMFPQEDYCVDRNSALVCGAPKGVRHCCGKNAYFSQDSGSCRQSSQQSDPLENVTTNTGFPVCNTGKITTYMVLGMLDDRLDARLNGSYLKLGHSAQPVHIDDFCLVRLEEDSFRIAVFVCSHSNNDVSEIRPEIRPIDDVHEGDIRLTLYPAGLSISAFFLAATLATAFLVPKAHHALHWRCQTCHVACLLVADIMLAVVQFSGRSISDASPESCTIIAVLMHFFFLSSFFWLNAMCFNIWWTFRDLRPVSADPAQERFRYRAFSVYAWGVPLFITCVALTLDLLPMDESMTNTFVRPRFGEKRCWFYGGLDIITFFYGPVGLLLILNFLLFAATTRELTCGLWRREGVKTGNGSHSSAERTTLGYVCLKLVVVMGVTWLADVVSWFVGGPSYLWYVTDLINALQGVFIFIVVGCQPQVWAAFKRLWWCGRRQNLPQAAANPMSQTSQGLPSTTAAETTSSPGSKSNGEMPPLETVC